MSKTHDVTGPRSQRPDGWTTFADESDLAGILIVEDDYLIAEDVAHVVRTAGYQVVGVAVDADEAIALAEVTKPDLVLMDIRLAGASCGIETAKILRQRFQIPCIFTTAYADPLTRERAADAHAVGWLSKPYDSKYLIELVRRALGERDAVG